MTAIKLLLVDDNAVFARTAIRIIQDTFPSSPQLRVLPAASSGEEALERVSFDKPDLVLMDLKMPGINGIEATRRIKASEVPPKVILISLCEIEELQRAAEIAGADGYLTKATLLEQLPAMIRTVLDRDPL